MQRLISAICAGLILGAGLVLAFAQPAENAQQKLQGTWTATKAERDGNAADDVGGHRAQPGTPTKAQQNIEQPNEQQERKRQPPKDGNHDDRALEVLAQY
jgi:hypothetical protein